MFGIPLVPYDFLNKFPLLFQKTLSLSISLYYYAYFHTYRPFFRFHKMKCELSIIWVFFFFVIVRSTNCVCARAESCQQLNEGWIKHLSHFFLLSLFLIITVQRQRRRHRRSSEYVYIQIATLIKSHKASFKARTRNSYFIVITELMVKYRWKCPTIALKKC